jgi:hypothetical protein
MKQLTEDKEGEKKGEKPLGGGQAGGRKETPKKPQASPKGSPGKPQPSPRGTKTEEEEKDLEQLSKRGRQRVRKQEREKQKAMEQKKRREVDPFFFTKEDFTPEPEVPRPFPNLSSLSLRPPSLIFGSPTTSLLFPHSVLRLSLPFLSSLHLLLPSIIC